MKLKKSPLKIFESFVIETKIQAVEPEGSFDREVIFNDYRMDFDFFIKKEKGGIYMLFTKVLINGEENALPGYVIFVEMVTALGFDKKTKLSKVQQEELINISGLNMAISNLRNYILNITSYGPFGKYVLPSVDLMAIHKDKAAEINEKKN